MTIFYIGTGIGLVLAVVYLVVGTASFLRIRRDLLTVRAADGEAESDRVSGGSNTVSVVPGFTWKAGLAVFASFLILVAASYGSSVWYLMALGGLGTAAAVITAFVSERRSDSFRA